MLTAITKSYVLALQAPREVHRQVGLEFQETRTSRNTTCMQVLFSTATRFRKKCISTAATCLHALQVRTTISRHVGKPS